MDKDNLRSQLPRGAAKENLSFWETSISLYNQPSSSHLLLKNINISSILLHHTISFQLKNSRMNHDQQQFPSSAAYPPPPKPYVTAPPAGYPMSKDESQKSVAVETKSRGDGFWKGCCAALCCCCVLDACF
ncbi:hypothetical protein V6N13_067864 [Hibiscus sabdariffa]